jgi:hypothetical protein
VSRSTLDAPEGQHELSDGRPDPAELSLRTRLIVGASAATDVLVRTALASAVTASALPWSVSRRARRERDQLRFYEELGEDHDREAVFAKPAGVYVRRVRPGPWSFKAPGGQVTGLRFESPYVALNPAVREEYSGYARNRTAWAQHWRHREGPRPTLCVVHGFAASPYFVNSAFFALPWLYGKGYDVLLYVMPFHGPRRDLRSPMNGAGLFANGPSVFNEGIVHAVHDFRAFVDYLVLRGVPAVGVTGLSLGGYMSALLAAVDERLSVSIPNAPVTSLGPLARDWFPLNAGMIAASMLHGVSLEEAERALVLHSPLHYAPLVDRSGLMIIGGLGDRLAPPEQAQLLWEHWDRPRLHWYPGNHILHVNRAAYLREMRQFMEDAGFGPDARAA